MSLPQAEEKLKGYLGDQYKWADWNPAYSAVMEAEQDVPRALEGLSKLTMNFLNCLISDLPDGRISTAPSTAPIPVANNAPKPNLPQLQDLETGLQEAVNKLKQL